MFASQKHPGGWDFSSQWTEWQVNSEVSFLTVRGMQDNVSPFHFSIETRSVIHWTCVRQPGDLLERTNWSRIHTAILLTQTSGKEKSLLGWWPELPFSISEIHLLGSVCHVGMTSNEICPFIQRTGMIIACSLISPSFLGLLTLWGLRSFRTSHGLGLCW